ncbi:MAG: hypothetical protein COA44_03000 [Arcobacter sp.]|nr:MAG: hypothetical protein COA44_03000 [Arcobacter sp.]
MAKAQKIITIVFDKNMNLLLRTDPVFTFLFPHITTLTSFNTFLAKNRMLEDNFLAKLNIQGKEHHVCYKCIDLQETFEFQFFLLDDDWMIVNPTGRHDIHDQLTGLLTQRSLIALLDHEIKSAIRDKDDYTALIIDISHLTDINETFGYLAGDTIIKTIAKLLQDASRSSDPLGRYKGDKFIIMLHKTDLDGALHFIKKFEKSLLSQRFHFSDINFNIQVNYALSCVTPTQTVDALLDHLHQQLLSAKETASLEMKYST